MRFKVPLLLALGATIGVSIAYAAILQTIQFGGTVNVLVTGGADVSYEIYLDEACTQPLTEPLDFGSAHRGESKLGYWRIWIKNTGTTTWTLYDCRTDHPKISISRGGYSTVGPGEVNGISLSLHVRHDAPAGQQNFTILLDRVG